jgi:dTDP-glucose pyrophosphorylase
MKAIILAAGLGTRLRPLTNDVPKSMISIAGKPLLERIILDLKKYGIGNFVIVVNYLKEKIIDYFSDGSKFGVKINYVVQENPRGGTAAAVLAAKNFVKDKSFFVVAGDELKDFSIAEVMANEDDSIITAFKVENPEEYGVLEVDGKNVLRIREKETNPVSNIINISFYKFPIEIFEAIDKIKPSPRGELEITDAINKLIEEGHAFRFIESKNYFDISSMEGLEEARKFFSKN